MGHYLKTKTQNPNPTGKISSQSKWLQFIKNRRKALSIILFISTFAVIFFVIKVYTPNPGKPASSSTPAPALTPTPALATAPIYGPTTGSIKHIGPKSTPIVCAKVDVGDFIMEVKFANPYDWRDFAWSYGVFFRYGSINNHYRLTISSSERLGFGITRDGIVSLISAGTHSVINRSADEYNTIRVEAKGDEAKVYINNTFATSLNIGERAPNGDVCLATGILGQDSIEGKETKYSEFTIYEIK